VKALAGAIADSKPAVAARLRRRLPSTDADSESEGDAGGDADDSFV
jgi:hypothetical protein